MIENNTNSTTIQQAKKYPNLRQLDFNRIYIEDKIEEDIADYEREFKYLDSNLYPTRWYYVQMELGELYRRIMFKWEKDNVTPP